MKFGIWCTKHDCAVIGADDDPRLLFKAPNGNQVVDGRAEPVFEIDESELYCLQEGFEHEFLLRIDGDKVMIDPPGKIVP